MATSTPIFIPIYLVGVNWETTRLWFTTSGAGIAFPSGAPTFNPDFKWGSCYSIFSVMCMFCRSLFVHLSLFGTIVLSNRKGNTIVKWNKTKGSAKNYTTTKDEREPHKNRAWTRVLQTEISYYSTRGTQFVVDVTQTIFTF